MRLNENDLLFLERFAKTPEGQAYLELLDRNLAHVSLELRTLTGEDLYRAQGKAVLLDVLTGDLRGAGKRASRGASPGLRPVRPLH
jgi:hypothetical protein